MSGVMAAVRSPDGAAEDPRVARARGVCLFAHLWRGGGWCGAHHILGSSCFFSSESLDFQSTNLYYRSIAFVFCMLWLGRGSFMTGLGDFRSNIAKLYVLSRL